MKHLFFYIGVVVGMTALIISCSSDDDAAKSTASSTTAITVANSCTGNETVSTVTGDGIARVIGELRYAAETGNEDNVSTVRNREISGRYSYTFDNSTTSACINNSTWLTSKSLPSSVRGLKHQMFVTSSSTYSMTTRFFSDTSCESETAFIMFTFDNVTVGDNVSTLVGPIYDNVSGAVRGDAGTIVGGVNVGLPDTGTKVLMNDDRVCMYASDNDTRNVVNGMMWGSPHKLLDNDSFSTVLDNDTSNVTLPTGWSFNYKIFTSVDYDAWEGWDSSKIFLVQSDDNRTSYPDNYTEVCCTEGGALPADVYFSDNASN